MEPISRGRLTEEAESAETINHGDAEHTEIIW